MLAVGVGHDEDPLTEMRGTKGNRWQTVPLRIHPERGQVAETSANSPSKQSCDVFHDDVAGS